MTPDCVSVARPKTIVTALHQECAVAARGLAQRRLQSARVAARNALGLARRAGLSTLIGWALLHLALVRILSGEFRRAEYCSRAATEHFDLPDAAEARVLVLNNHAVYLSSQGRFNAALESFAAALGSVKPLPGGLRGLILHNRAVARLSAGDLDTAVRDADHSVQAYRQAADIEGQCLALLLSGHLAYLLGRGEHSLRILLRARALSEGPEFGRARFGRSLRAKILFKYAVLLAHRSDSMRQRTRALGAARTAARAAAGCSDHRLEAAALVVLARCSNSGQVPVLLGRAHLLAESVADPELQRQVLNARTLHLQEIGDLRAAYNCGLQEQKLWRCRREDVRRRERARDLRAGELDSLRRRSALMHAQGQSLAAGNRELEHVNAQIRGLERERHELLELAAHELKNPLAALVLDISIMQNYALRMPPEERRTRVRAMHTAVLRLREIVDDVLHAHSLEAFADSVSTASLDPLPLLRGLIAGFEAKAQRKQITIISDLAAGGCCLAGRKALRHAVENLLSNAIKFSPCGRCVWLSLKPVSGALQIRVQDEGPGIPAAERAQLFTKYARLSTKATGGEHSSGLGLALVKKLMQAMQGQVWHETPGKGGACFVLQLREAQCR